MMDAAARIRLSEHAFVYDLDSSFLTDGFLGRLRPYRGLDEDCFHDLMATLHTLADEFASPRVDRTIIGDALAICFYARAWGVRPDGMLVADGAISPDDSNRLAGWIDHIAGALTVLTSSDATDADELRRLAFADYAADYPGRLNP